MDTLLHSGDKNANTESRLKINRYYNDKTFEEWYLMLRRAYMDEGGKESDTNALLEATKICGDLCRAMRGKYWEVIISISET